MTQPVRGHRRSGPHLCMCICICVCMDLCSAPSAGRVRSVMPFNAQAMGEVGSWQTYKGPTSDYGETVYCVTPHADAAGQTLVALISSARDRGVSCRYTTGSLPALSLWKNTDTIEEGYVTGIEPGSGFPFRRPLERAANRVPKLAAGASVSFSLEWQVLRSEEDVAAIKAEIASIQRGRQVQVDGSSPMIP